MIGIYKITSPTNKVYIGQSVNIEKRFNIYRLMHCKIQPKLYNSLVKHGVQNHIFEVIEECDFEVLNERERHYQDFYDVIGEMGLNCVLTSTKTKPVEVSQETRIKIGLGNKGKIVSKETCEKIKIAVAGNNIGRTHSEETKRRIGKAVSGLKRSMSDRLKMSYSRNPKKIIDTETGVIYNSLLEVSFIFGLKYTPLKCKLQGKSKNNTNFIYIEKRIINQFDDVLNF